MCIEAYESRLEKKEKKGEEEKRKRKGEKEERKRMTHQKQVLSWRA